MKVAFFHGGVFVLGRGMFAGITHDTKECGHNMTQHHTQNATEAERDVFHNATGIAASCVMHAAQLAV